MRHRPSHALAAAVVCGVGLVLTGLIAFHWPLVRAHDAASLAGFVALGSYPRLHGLADLVANSVDPAPYAVFGGLLVLIALVRRRWLLALVVPLEMLGAAATTELLKPIVGRVRYSDWFGAHNQIAAASWPSGHATASMTVALCAVVVVPAVARPVVALLGCALAIGVSYSILILRWHFPSDVLGGYIVAALWISLALAVLWWGQDRWPARNAHAPETLGVRSLFLPLAGVALFVGAAFGVLLIRTRLAAAYASVHASLLIGAALIAMLAAVLVASVAVVMRPVATAGAGDGAPAPRARYRLGLPRARL
jgi:membrane-associated phospholipid phosphatase